MVGSSGAVSQVFFQPLSLRLIDAQECDPIEKNPSEW